MTKRFNRLFKIVNENLDPVSSVLSVDHAKKFVTICAWCDKNKIETQKWLDKGYTTSHGLCEACSDRMLAELD